MTREEAITNLEKLAALFYTESEQSKMVDYSKIIEVLEFAAAALRPASREQVEQVWRSYWDGFSNGYADGYEVYDEWQCRKCGFEVETDGPETLPQFCPSCGAPMTGEAVDILLKRLEAQKDELSRLQAP